MTDQAVVLSASGHIIHYAYASERSGCYELEMNGTAEDCAILNRNGILNSRKECVDSSILVSQSYGNRSVMVLHSSSHGFFTDILQCLALKLGFKTHSVEVLVNAFKQQCSEKSAVYANFHSRGALEAKCALQYLTDDELAKINIRTYGGASMILNDKLATCYNYVSTMDPVPFVSDPIGVISSWWKGDERVVFLPSNHCLPIDHAFNGETYQKALKSMGDRDLELIGKLCGK